MYLNQNITFKNNNKKKIIQIEPSIIDEALIFPFIQMRFDESMKPNKDYELNQKDKKYLSNNLEGVAEAFPDKKYYINLYRYTLKETNDSKFYVRWNRRCMK
jgi:hypothetical protein